MYVVNTTYVVCCTAVQGNYFRKLACTHNVRFMVQDTSYVRKST